MNGAPNTPSHEYRLLIERLGQAFNEGIQDAVGRPVDMGLPGSWDDHETDNRPVPIRAIIVRFGRPLRDMALFVTSLKEEYVRPIAQAAAASVLEELGIEPGTDAYGAVGSITVEAAVEYETTAEAMEQCDGFYLEPTIHYALPNGDLCLVMGTGLLQSADCFLAGEADPYAEPLPEPQPGLVGAAGSGAGDDAARYEFDGGNIGGDAAAGLQTGQVGYAGADVLGTGRPADAAAMAAAQGDDGVVYTDQGPMSVAQYEAMLAADAQADAHVAAAADANAAAAAAAIRREQPEQRWASLLSGVEVEVSAELGRTNLALGDLASLIFDSVLTLDQMVDEPVNVYVNGTAYATARLVIVEGEFGIEILDVVGAAELVEQLAA